MTDLEIRINFIETLKRLELATDNMPIVMTCMIETCMATALDQFGMPNEVWISPINADALKLLK